MKDWIEVYGKLLAEYSLYLKPGELVFVRSTTIAEPLVSAFHKHALRLGARVEIELNFEGEEENIIEFGSDDALSALQNNAIELISKCDAYLLIRAPLVIRDLSHVDPERKKKRQNAHAAFSEIYFKRLGDGSLKRSLCQFPTLEYAERAGMNLLDYSNFIQKACYLDQENPAAHWQALSKVQQGYVDYLNQVDVLCYEHKDWRIECSVKGRTWINSDGKSNMPSGEVFTSPIEASVNGNIYFGYPTMMFGKDVEGIFLKVENGKIISWEAQKGQDVLDEVFAIEGARYFGEIAIGTNQNIQQATKNILFDEKIGGTVHMAVGQSYYQCGGKNKSSIHWDLITDMKSGGKIYADGKLIYENGIFLI